MKTIGHILFDNLLTRINRVGGILQCYLRKGIGLLHLKHKVALRFDPRYLLVPLAIDFSVKIFFSKETSRFDLEII